MIQATDPMRLLRILEHRARSPDIFLKIAVASRDPQVSARKKTSKNQPAWLWQIHLCNLSARRVLFL
jgi:hypothetical protein